MTHVHFPFCKRLWKSPDIPDTMDIRSVWHSYGPGLICYLDGSLQVIGGGPTGSIPVLTKSRLVP